MFWVSLVAALLLFFGALGGLKEGAIKQGFALAITLAAIPLAGLSFRFLARLLSFLPGENWENFLGLALSLGIISALLHLLTLGSRRMLDKAWKKAPFFRLLGGTFGFLNTCFGLTVFALAVRAYPVFDWLARWLAASRVMQWLVANFGFVESWLFRNTP